MGWKIRACQKQDNARQGKAGRALEYWSIRPLEHRASTGLLKHRQLEYQSARQMEYRTSTRPLEHKTARPLEYRTSTGPLEH